MKAENGKKFTEILVLKDDKKTAFEFPGALTSHESLTGVIHLG